MQSPNDVESERNVEISVIFFAPFAYLNHQLRDMTRHEKNRDCASDSNNQKLKPPDF